MAIHRALSLSLSLFQVYMFIMSFSFHFLFSLSLSLSLLTTTTNRKKKKKDKKEGEDTDQSLLIIEYIKFILSFFHSNKLRNNSFPLDRCHCSHSFSSIDGSFSFSINSIDEISKTSRDEKKERESARKGKKRSIDKYNDEITHGFRLVVH